MGGVADGRAARGEGYKRGGAVRYMITHTEEQ